MEISWVVFMSLLSLGLCQAPATMTPAISVVPGYDSSSDMFLGSVTRLEVEVQFPAGMSENVNIELLPSIDTTIMVLGEVNATHIGSNLNALPTPNRFQTAESVGQPVQYDSRCVFSVGDVNNIETSPLADDNTYRIEFEALLVSLGSLSDNDIHWVSAGVEYNNSYNVWIGQVSYNVRTAAMTTSKTPVFTINNPYGSNLPVNSIFKIEVDAWLPFPFSSYSAEGVSLSTDDALTIIGLTVKSSGNNYDFLFEYSLLESTAILTCDSDTPGEKRIRLDVGTVPNKGSNQGSSATADDSIVFEITAFLAGSAVIGDVYSVGVGVEIDASQVWVSYVNFTADPPTTFAGSFTTAVNPPDGSLVPIGGTASFSVNITFEPETSSRYSVMVETREKTNTHAAGLAVISVSVLNSGSNVPCPDIDTGYEMSDPASGFLDRALMDLNVTNFGTTADANADTIEIGVIGLAMPGRALDGETYVLKVTVSNVDTAASNIMEGEFTIGGSMTYDSPVAYSFSMYHKCTTNCMLTGNKFDFFLDVITEINTNPGPVTIEFPVPSNISNNVFKICSFEAIDIGKNIPCVNNALVTSQANLTTGSDGMHEKVIVTIDPLCNFGFGNETIDNQFTLKMTATFLNESEIVNEGTEWYGVGVKYSDTQVWVAQIQVSTKTANYYPSLAIVEGVVVTPDPNGTITDFTLKSSIDGNTFIDKALDWNTGNNNGSHDVYLLPNPFITTYVRLGTDGCIGTCYVDHDFIYTSLDGYLDIFRDTGDILLQQFPLALDGDMDTCFPMPVQGDTPPVLWARMNATLMGILIDNFEMNVTGEGLYCDRHDNTRIVQISYPMSTETDIFHADLGYCSHTMTTPETGSKTTCTHECSCTDIAHCAELFLFFANYDRGPWSLCELSAKNI